MRRGALSFLPFKRAETDREPDDRGAKPWWTMEEAATRWEISPETVRKRIAKGDIQVQRFGRLVRISFDEILRLEKGGWR